MNKEYREKQEMNVSKETGGDSEAIGGEKGVESRAGHHRLMSVHMFKFAE